uniref:Uncharacterized protein n=1 Tax=Rhizophora mucronata TaxID=61149 RepID=A0A2P2P9A1_RHIMU
MVRLFSPLFMFLLITGATCAQHFMSKKNNTHIKLGLGILNFS